MGPTVCYILRWVPFPPTQHNSRVSFNLSDSSPLFRAVFGLFCMSCLGLSSSSSSYLGEGVRKRVSTSFLEADIHPEGVDAGGFDVCCRASDSNDIGQLPRQEPSRRQSHVQRCVSEGKRACCVAWGGVLPWEYRPRSRSPPGLAVLEGSPSPGLLTPLFLTLQILKP